MLILGHIVGGGKMNLQCVLELVALWRAEDDAGSQDGVHLGPIEVHPPMGGVRRWQQYWVSAQSTKSRPVLGT